MNDTEFLAALEFGTLAPGTFHHRDHLRAVWCLLHRYPLLEAMSRTRDGLRLLTANAGAEEKYHETITAALVLIIHERMLAAPSDSWEDFECANVDLMEWRSGALLAPYYSPETLASDLARTTFVLPERSSDRRIGRELRP